MQRNNVVLNSIIRIIKNICYNTHIGTSHHINRSPFLLQTQVKWMEGWVEELNERYIILYVNTNIFKQFSAGTSMAYKRDHHNV